MTVKQLENDAVATLLAGVPRKDSVSVKRTTLDRLIRAAFRGGLQAHKFTEPDNPTAPEKPSMKKSQRLPRAGTTWTCPNCPNDPLFAPAEFKKHLLEVHGVNVSKGNRRMLMHLDTQDHYFFNFEWEIAGKKYFQSVCRERAENDPMRFH